jgi:hypothetical protein
MLPRNTTRFAGLEIGRTNDAALAMSAQTNDGHTLRKNPRSSVLRLHSCRTSLFRLVEGGIEGTAPPLGASSANQ